MTPVASTALAFLRTIPSHKGKPVTAMSSPSLTYVKLELIGSPLPAVPVAEYFQPEPWGVYTAVMALGAAIPVYLDFAVFSFHVPVASTANAVADARLSASARYLCITDLL